MHLFISILFKTIAMFIWYQTNLLHVFLWNQKKNRLVHLRTEETSEKKENKTATSRWFVWNWKLWDVVIIVYVCPCVFDPWKVIARKKGKKSFYEIGVSQSRFSFAFSRFSSSRFLFCLSFIVFFFYFRIEFCLQVTNYNHHWACFWFLISFENVLPMRKLDWLSFKYTWL